MNNIPRQLYEPGISNTFIRTLLEWTYAKRSRKTSYQVKFLIAYFYFHKIGPAYHRFIPWITQYYPFSLMFRGSLMHAEGLKARNLMRGMEALALEKGMPVYINNGYWDEGLSVFYGKFERGGLNKKDCIAKLQQLFQEKFGTIYVQEQKVGFKILVDSKLL